MNVMTTLSPQCLALHYGLRLDASPEFIQGYVDGMRLDQRGQGVACGRGWIPRSKKCSRDKAKQTSKEAKAKTVEKAKARAKLKGEVKAAKGQKPRNLTPDEKRKRGGQITKSTYTKTEAAQAFKSLIEKEFPSIRVSVWEKGGKTRAYVKDTTQRRSGAQDRGYISFDDTGVDNSKYRGFMGGGEVVKKFINETIIR